MKKCIFCFVVCVFVSGFVCSGDTFVAEPVVVSGVKVNGGESFYQKEVVPSDVIENSSEFSDLFFSSNLFDFTNYGETGSLLNVNVDGASGRQTLVTIDGVKLNDGSNGEFDLSLIEPELLSTLTGIRNNASPMYGANASGGVLEMRGFNFSEDKLGFSFGSHNYRKMFFRKMIDKNTSFFASDKEYNGKIADSSGRQSTFYLKNQDIKNTLSVLYTDRKKYTPGSISFPAPGEYTDSVLSVISFNSRINSNLFFKAGKIKNDSDNFNLAINNTTPVDNENEILELSYRKGDYAFGVSKEKQQVYVESPWGGKYDEERDINSVFFEYIMGKNIYLNFRQDGYDDFDDEDIYNITYKLSDKIQISFGEGYSLPTFNQLYWPGFSNPLLKAEYSEIYSLNYTNREFSMYLFSNEYTDLMQYDSTLFKTINIAEAQIKGFELKYDINQDMNIFYKHQDPENKTNNSKLNYKQLNKAGINYKKDNCLLNISHIGKRFNNGKEFPQATVVNVKMIFDNAFISVLNLFDKEYVIKEDYEKACRELTFGFELSI